MEKEDQIIGMLEKILEKQDEHSRILEEHSTQLREHGILLKEHSVQLKEHSTQLGEHGQILTALRSGQEYLKAEMDGMKIGNAKEFGTRIEENSPAAINQELIREETWAHKVDIQRIKKTLGMI
ncbi:hypothetical protein [Oceanobacillus rekensis]|uniref:hypothetical protein n=1 Tax=Oceanobacillus rekensis TaxID=937927 RepID=UPI000B42E9D7|nr:hypothetical protein [Oceanobacillus rekensis]